MTLSSTLAVPNATHGLRRTNKDKRKAVTKLLSDEEWATWSDLEISRRCRVSDDLVKTVRSELAAGHLPATLGSESEGRRTYRTKYGSVATMDTKAIGRSPRSSTSSAKTPKSVTVDAATVERTTVADERKEAAKEITGEPAPPAIEDFSVTVVPKGDLEQRKASGDLNAGSAMADEAVAAVAGTGTRNAIGGLSDEYLRNTAMFEIAMAAGRD